MRLTSKLPYLKAIGYLDGFAYYQLGRAYEESPWLSYGTWQNLHPELRKAANSGFDAMLRDHLQ